MVQGRGMHVVRHAAAAAIRRRTRTMRVGMDGMRPPVPSTGVALTSSSLLVEKKKTLHIGRHRAGSCPSPATPEEKNTTKERHRKQTRTRWTYRR